MKNFLRKQKRCVTLLETLIALSLLTVLLVIIFSFFKEMTVISSLTEVKQKEAFKLRYLESRLAYFFERVVNEKAKDRNFYFYVEPTPHGQSPFPSLVFTFNNEIRADPLFSEDILGRLYVDTDKNLCLVTWPIHVEHASKYMNKEVLMENVEKLTFRMYAAPEPVTSRNFVSSTVIDPNKPERDLWHENEWRMVYNEMPVIIKIELEIKEKQSPVKEWKFAFVLPSTNFPIYYPPS